MLPYGNGCTPDGEVVCSALFTVGESILDVALKGLNDYSYADACDAPMIEGIVTVGEGGDDEIVRAPPHLIHANAGYSYSHAEMMYRPLAAAVMGRTLEGMCGEAGCFSSIGDLVPVDPDGHTVGWQTSCVVEVDISRGCNGGT